MKKKTKKKNSVQLGNRPVTSSKSIVRRRPEQANEMRDSQVDEGFLGDFDVLLDLCAEKNKNKRETGQESSLNSPRCCPVKQSGDAYPFVRLVLGRR